MLDLTRSTKAFDDAKDILPGGVDSPVRSYRSVDSNPPFISSASGDHMQRALKFTTKTLMNTLIMSCLGDL